MFAIIVVKELAPLMKLTFAKYELPVCTAIVPILGMDAIAASILRGGRQVYCGAAGLVAFFAIVQADHFAFDGGLICCFVHTDTTHGG